MTKEEFLENISNFLKENHVVRGKLFNEFVDEFFESNVCIPKGENRHTYADVLHEWVEGAELEWRDTLIGGKWNYNEKIPTIEYRIKPSEPIYEWQYLLLGNGENSLSEEFYTDDEFNDSLFWQKSIKLEETKRERT